MLAAARSLVGFCSIPPEAIEKTHSILLVWCLQVPGEPSNSTGILHDDEPILCSSHLAERRESWLSYGRHSFDGHFQHQRWKATQTTHRVRTTATMHHQNQRHSPICHQPSNLHQLHKLSRPSPHHLRQALPELKLTVVYQ
jgi:hypothetical protein